MCNKLILSEHMLPNDGAYLQINDNELTKG